MVGLNYKGVYVETNPWKYGQGEYQDILGVRNEPELIIYTPDVECYCETIQDAKDSIDEWIQKNGSVEEYNFKADIRIGWNRLEVVK